jgi:hypothetical protein
MVKNRDVSNKIWRTVVVAGAMLGAPLAIGCGGGQKPPATDNGQAASQDKAAADKAAADQATADKAAADKASADKAADQAADQQAAADKAAADKAAADQAAADQAAADAAAKRPRSNGNDRPRGRGFVLA